MTAGEGLMRPDPAVSPVNDNGIVWETPPKPRRGRGLWVDVLAPLVERPNEWARIAEKKTAKLAGTTASNLRKGIVAVPPGRWEFVSRTVNNGDGKHFYIYAVYLGLEDAS